MYRRKGYQKYALEQPISESSQLKLVVMDDDAECELVVRQVCA